MKLGNVNIYIVKYYNKYKFNKIKKNIIKERLNYLIVSLTNNIVVAAGF
jgi:hypothetical protein